MVRLGGLGLVLSSRLTSWLIEVRTKVRFSVLFKLLCAQRFLCPINLFCSTGLISQSHNFALILLTDF